jgi:hypothetical protein
MSIEYQAMGHVYVLTNWLDFGLDLQGQSCRHAFSRMASLERPDPADSA